MAYARVGASQAVAAGGITSTTGQSLTRTAGTVGNLLVVSGYTADRTQPVTIADTQGNVWTTVNPDLNDATNSVRMQSWYALAKNTLSTTVTVKSTSAGNGFWGMTLEEFSGNHLTTPLDQVNNSGVGASGTNPTGPAITLGADDCLVWAIYIDSATTPFLGNIDGSAATLGANDSFQDVSEFRVLVGRTGIAVAAGFIGTGAYDYFIASFKPPTPASTRSWILGRH